jgi:hypothetical protein
MSLVTRLLSKINSKVGWISKLKKNKIQKSKSLIFKIESKISIFLKTNGRKNKIHVSLLNIYN